MPAPVAAKKEYFTLPEGQREERVAGFVPELHTKIYECLVKKGYQQYKADMTALNLMIQGKKGCPGGTLEKIGHKGGKEGGLGCDGCHRPLAAMHEGIELEEGEGKVKLTLEQILKDPEQIEDMRSKADEIKAFTDCLKEVGLMKADNSLNLGQFCINKEKPAAQWSTPASQCKSCHDGAPPKLECPEED